MDPHLGAGAASRRFAPLLPVACHASVVRVPE